MVICLQRGADLHIAQLMPLPLTVSCSSKIQIGFTFLAPAYLGSPGKRAVKRVCVYVFVHITAIHKERDADLHMAQLMLLPLTDSCCSKIQTGFTFLAPAHPDSPGQRAVKRMCVCVFVAVIDSMLKHVSISLLRGDLCPSVATVNLLSAFKNISVPGLVP